MITATLNRNLVGTFGALVLGLAFVGAATAPAQAATLEHTSKIVSYSDLNLSSQAGRDAFAARVRSAAKSVCTVGSGDLASQTAEARCVKASIEAAKAHKA